jgi:hypothetical protein
MQTTGFILLGVVVVCFGIWITSVANRAHWKTNLWMGCAGICIAIIGGTCLLHDKWDKEDKQKSGDGVPLRAIDHQ